MSRALDLYESLCEDLARPALIALSGEVRAYYGKLAQAQETQELIAIDLAELLCLRLQVLLAAAHELEPGARAAIVGAARYFVCEEDAVPDEQACTGLDDDVEVFNHVVRGLSRDDLLILD